MIKQLLHIFLFTSLLFTVAFGQKEFGKVTLPLGRVQVQKGGNGDFKKAMIVNTKDMKGLCKFAAKFDSEDERNFVTADLYSQNERMCISIILSSKRDLNQLETDFFTILGGIKMPDHPDDHERVSRDINRIVSQFNKT